MSKMTCLLTGRGLGLLALLLMIGSCGPGRFAVSQGPHRPGDPHEAKPIRVRRTPPPTEVEVLPLRRNTDCYYLDGHWQPQGTSWRWQKGSWVLPPEGCYYAAPTTSYEKIDVGVTLVHRPGLWLTRTEGKGPCDAPKPCPATNASDD